MADVLFSKKLPVVLKSADREDRNTHIKISVEVQVHTAPLHRKELVVRLTDESDLFFLYTLKLGEEDFQSLKCQQGLLVDFGAFPQKFIDLLELCLQEERRESPKYLLQFLCPAISGSDKDTWALNVVETNPFKHLTHLSLRFLPGKDNDVKKYLADCLKMAKDQISSLQGKLETTECSLSEKLFQTQQALSDKTQQYDAMKLELSSTTNDMNAKYSQQAAMEKEKAVEAHQQYQQRCEREKRELEQAHLKIVKQMEAKIYDYESVNKELTDKRYKHESHIRELKSKLGSLEEEYHRAKQELNALRKDNASLDADFHEQEKLINQLRTKVAVTEQETRDKDQVMSKAQELLQSEQEQRKKCEDDLERRQKQIGKMETSIKSMSEELVKGNEIIKKLQGEIRNYHAKVKLRNQITTEQEKLLGEKEQELEKLRQDYRLSHDTLRVKEDENSKLSESLESTMRKLEESKQLLKTNENVINWLNKQITENQLSHQRHMPMENAAISYKPPNLMNGPSIGGSISRMTNDTLSPGSTAPLTRHYSSSLSSQLGLGRERRTNVPLSATKPSTINEESGSAASSPSSQKENEAPFLDAKYLSRGDGAPLREKGQRSSSPSTVQGNQQLLKSQPNSMARPMANKVVPSAYFPTQAKVS
ncbi:spindle assembly abnormal protein 6 homolog [Lineus longissimus]|uniref:spindle assembly abnormal protein 6 homolog n=1 Tax=Lineus longissimus TaxID=88925 RepID=UPI002B4F1766